MRFEHPDHPGRRVHLAYCLNLHGAEDLPGTLRGIREITLPLRDRLAEGRVFGVGLYLPASVALRLAGPDGERDLEDLAAELEREGLDAFTHNAFPYGGFHADGLKRAVFAPAWFEAQRLEFTLAVARVAARLARGRGGLVSISTHSGRFGPFAPGELERATANLGRCLEGLAALSEAEGLRLRLAIEAEPRASAGDTRELEGFLEHLERALDPGLVRAHLGACLDACHSAVEFEAPAEVLRRGLRLPLGKLQVSSALALCDPAAHPQARDALLALDEPRYLHQTTGRHGAVLLRCDDLPELAAALADPASSWLACDEWRTHFHVPVDLEALGGLGTTRAHAEALVEALLADPACWGDPDLHLELETYTWDVLPGAARGAGDLVDGLEREYAPVLRALQRGGWRPADPAPPGAQESAGAR